MMIEYIIHEKLHTIIYKTQGKISINKSMQSVINELCENHLTSFKGYLKAVHKKLGSHYKNPLYLSQSLQLIPTQSYKAYENVWINKVCIEELKSINKQTLIIFYSGHQLKIDKDINYMKNQMKRLEKIIKFSSKHFHF